MGGVALVRLNRQRALNALDLAVTVELGGLMLAAFHDLRVAAEGTRFGLPEITLGWPPAYGIQRLIQLLGDARACELVLSGAQFEAEEARRIGLVNRVVPSDVVYDQALGWANELSRLPAGGHPGHQAPAGRDCGGPPGRGARGLR